MKDINDKIADEQKREQGAIDEMHPRVRERVKAQTPAATSNAGSPNKTPATPQTFSIGAWKTSAEPGRGFADRNHSAIGTRRGRFRRPICVALFFSSRPVASVEKSARTMLSTARRGVFPGCGLYPEAVANMRKLTTNPFAIWPVLRRFRWKRLSLLT